jgi:ABC-2 type transport system ATP-binding protein
LDPNARREIWSILMDLKEQEQTTIILTTHYMEEAERLCDRIVIIDHGKILVQGTLAQLLPDRKEIILIGRTESERALLKEKPTTGVQTLDELFISLTGRHLHE